MTWSHFKELFRLPSFVKLPADLERKFRDSQRHNFVIFFRSALLFGLIAYCGMIVADWVTASKVFHHILVPRLSMVAFFALAIGVTFIRKFYIVGQYVGVAFILILMLNVIWIQSVIENGLEEGYGMLITPGATTSVIVFSGAEMGYGALLTPLLMLPIGFTAFQAFITSAFVVGIVNAGMYGSNLPSSFVETANSVFISIGVFTTILAYLVTQHRRAAFKLEHDLRIARDEAEEASSAKSNFLATMSHEVRTPLNGILGMASLLLQTDLNAKQEDYLQTVKYSGETLLAMLNDILDFSKMEAGKFQVETIDIDFEKLIGSVANLMTSRAEEQGIFIKVSLAGDVPPYIHSDPTRLRQVLLNLLSNAIKFTERGHVEIAVTKLSETNGEALLRFEVIDTGIGIPEEAMNKLFREFTQADSSTSRKYGGTGLGLSICKRIVELLEGQIQVKSEMGKGSTFWFDIPVGIADGDSFAVEDHKKEVVPDLHPLRILVAEDNKINAQITMDFLRTQDHTLRLAKDGHEAVAILEQEDFDIILMDMQMPGMDGVEATKVIKSRGDKKAEIPIIALTANNLQPEIDRCMEAGMIDYITKPFSKGELFGAIARHAGTLKQSSPNDKIAANDVSARPEDAADMDLSTLLDLEETFDRAYVIEFLQENIPTIEVYVDKIAACAEQEPGGDITPFLEIAHQLKGVGALCGFSELYALADAFENKCKEGKFEEAWHAAGLMRGVFDRNLAVVTRLYPAEYTAADEGIS